MGDVLLHQASFSVASSDGRQGSKRGVREESERRENGSDGLALCSTPFLTAFQLPLALSSTTDFVWRTPGASMYSSVNRLCGRERDGGSTTWMRRACE